MKYTANVPISTSVWGQTASVCCPLSPDMTCAPALVCPMALARPLAQLCNNKSLQPVPNPFCRHK